MRRCIHPTEFEGDTSDSYLQSGLASSDLSLAIDERNISEPRIDTTFPDEKAGGDGAGEDRRVGVNGSLSPNNGHRKDGRAERRRLQRGRLSLEILKGMEVREVRVQRGCFPRRVRMLFWAR